jgi:hypothetical protein
MRKVLVITALAALAVVALPAVPGIVDSRMNRVTPNGRSWHSSRIGILIL